jgi:hypothetical protein
MPYVLGFAGLGVFWVVLLIATGEHPWALVMGEDGRPSTSKFQMLVWLAAVVFGYLAIYEVRVSHGHYEGLADIPQNLLIAMGISVVTTISTKAIAVNASNRADAAAASAPTQVVATGPSVVAQEVGGPPVVVTPVKVAPPAAAPADLSGIFTDASGTPDLGKVQVVLWTAVAVGIFLNGVIAAIHNPAPCVANGACGQGIPDIGQTLMILMGLGHGAYIGGKIAQSQGGS